MVTNFERKTVLPVSPFLTEEANRYMSKLLTTAKTSGNDKEAKDAFSALINLLEKHYREDNDNPLVKKYVKELRTLMWSARYLEAHPEMRNAMDVITEKTFSGLKTNYDRLRENSIGRQSQGTVENTDPVVSEVDNTKKIG